MIKVNGVRLINNEELIGQLNETEDSISITVPLVVKYNANGYVIQTWTGILPQDNQTVTIPKSMVMYICDVNDEISQKYNSLFEDDA